ncbi:MAG: glycosyltransferase family 4 protein [Chloroflexi bacterium]|nr:glycosyltransferase family 4 protein [Chloroflexota bacterium]MCL5273703.1 glycosyltransferase family 4 protein [Chloroflexota bacterium]
MSEPLFSKSGDTEAGHSALRVLSIAPTSFFGDYGCHVRILEEARALKAIGIEVTILTYYKGADMPDIRTIRTARTPWHGDYEVGSSRHKYAFDVLLAIRLARVLARNHYDIIHAHLHEGALIGSIVSRPWRIPVCFDYQGSLTSEMLDHGFLRPNTRALGFWQWLEKAIENLPSAIFTSTQNASETLRNGGNHRIPIRPLPDGVNTDIFRPDVLTPNERAGRRVAFGLHPDDVVVVFLGLLARHQGIGCLIDAAALLKAQGRRVKWLVMGYPGVLHWRKVAQARGVSDAVVFTDRIPYQNAPHMLALGDIAIAPKLSLTEGSGKILDYMAMGLPTVAFDTPAQVEYLGNLGVYAPVGNVEELAQRVAELIDQPERRISLGQAARIRACQQFGWDRAASQLATVYYELTKRDTSVPLSVKPDSNTPRC